MNFSDHAEALGRRDNCTLLTSLDLQGTGKKWGEAGERKTHRDLILVKTLPRLFVEYNIRDNGGA